MGTRFLCTEESPIHPRIKQRLVANDERSTELIFRTLRNTARVVRNAVSSEVVEIGRRGGRSRTSVTSSPARGRRVFKSGDPDAGIWSAGLPRA